MTLAADGVVDLYSRRASDFDADRTKTLFERAWLDAFLAHVPLSGSILDLGCGSGQPIARYLIQSGRSVTGVDASPGLIALCRERFEDQSWIVADMRGLDLAQEFDGLVVWHSAIHLTPEDQNGMFAVYRSHLKPGGVLMFTSSSQAGEHVGEWRGEPLYHGSLSPDAYRDHLTRTGFELLKHRTSDPDCCGATVWLTRRRVSD